MRRPSSGWFDNLRPNCASATELSTILWRILPSPVIHAPGAHFKIVAGDDPMKRELSELDRWLTARFDRLERKIDAADHRVVAAMVIALGALFGALHFWPPH